MDPKLKRLQEQYKQVPIPEELDFVVKRALKAREKKRMKLKWLTGVSAASLVFVIGINMSASVANAFSGIPGIENIVRVLTFRE